MDDGPPKIYGECQKLAKIRNGLNRRRLRIDNIATPLITGEQRDEVAFQKRRRVDLCTGIHRILSFT
jgi:hypothetical protein